MINLAKILFHIPIDDFTFLHLFTYGTFTFVHTYRLCIIISWTSHLFILKPQYSWNTAKLDVKRQPINHILFYQYLWKFNTMVLGTYEKFWMIMDIVAKSSNDARNDIKTPPGGTFFCSSLFFMFSLVGNFLSI